MIAHEEIAPVVPPVPPSEPDPREFLRELREGNPSSSVDELLMLFRRAALEDERLLSAVLNHCFGSISRRWTRARAHPGSDEERNAVASMKETILGNAKTLFLMDLLLPHGKTLGNSTGADCLVLGPRVGKWLQVIGKEVPSGRLVGKTLTEKKVREIYASI